MSTYALTKKKRIGNGMPRKFASVHLPGPLYFDVANSNNITRLMHVKIDNAVLYQHMRYTEAALCDFLPPRWGGAALEQGLSNVCDYCIRAASEDETLETVRMYLINLSTIPGKLKWARAARYRAEQALTFWDALVAKYGDEVRHTIKPGHRFRFNETQGEWYCIDCDGQRGVVIECYALT